VYQLLNLFVDRSADTSVLLFVYLYNGLHCRIDTVRLSLMPKTKPALISQCITYMNIQG